MFQNAMLEGYEKLHPLLKILKGGSSWHNNIEYYHTGGAAPLGSVNLSTAWFQQGHSVSASIHELYSLVAHSESENVPKTPKGFYELQHACYIGLARCHI
jgi:hypothetical protein